MPRLSKILPILILAIVVASVSAYRSSSSVDITYLGTNCFVIRTGNEALLVDTFVSRSSMLKVGFTKIESDPVAVDFVNRELEGYHLRGQLITHSHFDHMLDAPAFYERHKKGIIVTSQTGKHLAEACGVPSSHIVTVDGADSCERATGKTIGLGSFRVTPVFAAHDSLLGYIFYKGTVEKGAKKPRRAGDWKLGEHAYAFIIEVGGKRIYIDSGGSRESEEVVGAAGLGKMDIAILGTALKPGQRRFAGFATFLDPKIIVPTHQDSFFKKLVEKEHGEVFLEEKKTSIFANPEDVEEAFNEAKERKGLRGKCKRMDYLETIRL